MAPTLPTLERLKTRDKRAIAEALAQIEGRPDDPDVAALLDTAWADPRSHVIGLTGPPGVGKSTLVRALIGRWRADERTVGVIAVDPSSRASGGALLGDRIRFRTDPGDQGIFVRSMAARDRLGGLAALTVSAMVVMRAIYDIVLIETVGVGQSETDVATVADTVVFCVQPGSGDSVQYMKAGIMEIPDIVVVTKADMGEAARRAMSDIESVLAVAPREAGWRVEILALSALEGQGVDALAAVLDRHRAWLAEDGRAVARRASQAAVWLEDGVRERFGRDGVERARALLVLPPGAAPFGREAEIARWLRPQ